MTYKAAAAVAGLLLGSTPAWAQDAPAAPAPVVLAPAFAGPLGNNPNPLSVDLGSDFGRIYITGVVSGIGSTQSHAIPGDDKSFADVDNAHVYIQKVDGTLQFLVQAGYYSFPALGFPYFRSATATDSGYGPVPQAWVKIAPTSNFSIQAGILPTLIGAEGIYTYQNINIDRGLLWGQENIFNRGVQANLTLGKLSLSVSLNDGFFSGKYNWVTGLASYAIDGSNTIAFVAGGATSKKYKATFATPTVLNNSSIYNIIYTYTKGPVMIQPYFQYTHIPTLPGIGTGTADTYSGAILARYNVSEHFSLPVRFEYIDSTGSFARNSPSLLYGPGSNAFSFTITPTFTYKVFFARAEFNIVKASSITPGFGFGSSGNERSQTRGLIEIGAVF